MPGGNAGSGAEKKVRERRTVYEGFAGRVEERVRALQEGESVPEGAEEVPADTPNHDWRVVGG